MARLQKTLTDYMVIAISPALIMTLVGSFVYFLIAVFYHGGFQGRMEYIFALFVFAAVLIARISIEEGREYSMMYAIPLALAMLLVLGRFTAASTLFNIVMLGVIWWCADKLTWDCTVIDERKDASGEGLLQTAGLEGSKDSTAAGPSAAGRDLEATTSRDTPASPKTWWERFVEHRKRPHAPGVWVIYFSLAALPLFGIGQRFIPAEQVDARRYAFKLLCVYTASGLGLLMTTSFLGLRRYLRQRRLEMPVEMAGVWLSVGSVMIVALLFVCWLLPRPSPEYSITQAPFRVTSPSDQRASRYGWGKEGAKDPHQQAPATAPAQKEQQGRPGAQGSEGRSDPEQSGDEHGAGASPGGSQGEGQQPGGQQPGGQQSGGQPAGEGRSGQSSSGSQGGGKQKSDGPSGGKDQKQSAASDVNQSQAQSGQVPAAPESGQTGQTGQTNQTAQSQPPDSPDGANAPPSASEENPFETEVSPSETPSEPSSWMPNPSEMFNSVLGLIPHGLKWLYNLIFIAIVSYLLWRNRERVLEALRNFWQAMRDFWANLFGGQRAEPAGEEAVAVPIAPPRPFADFPDPFATGDAQRWSPRDLVAYSFQALEAWGREHGCQRGQEQTPHEFAGRLVACEAALGREAGNLADLYCCAAYSTAVLPRDRVRRLQELWRVMRAR